MWWIIGGIVALGVCAWLATAMPPVGMEYGKCCRHCKETLSD